MFARFSKLTTRLFAPITVQTVANMKDNKGEIAYVLEQVGMASGLLDPMKKKVFYVDETEQLASDKDKEYLEKLHALVGIISELHEMYSVKSGKVVFAKNMVEEGGDLLFYIDCLLQKSGTSIKECMEVNHKKLTNRYKKGFSKKAAFNRNLAQEAEKMGV